MKILATVINYTYSDDMPAGSSKSGVIEIANANLPPCVREYLEHSRNKSIALTLVEEKGD